jgi:hypothetical protein
MDRDAIIFLTVAAALIAMWFVGAYVWNGGNYQ